MALLLNSLFHSQISVLGCQYVCVCVYLLQKSLVHVNFNYSISSTILQIKKAECQRIDAFELWCWRRLLRGGIARSSNRSILKEINPEYSLEGLMLKLQYFDLMRRANLLQKTLMLGKIEDRRRREQQRMRWLDGITESTDMSLIFLTNSTSDY